MLSLSACCRSIETMICDALRDADGAWNHRISAAIDDPRAYRRLTDAVLNEIQYSSEGECGGGNAGFIHSTVVRVVRFRYHNYTGTTILLSSRAQTTLAWCGRAASSPTSASGGFTVSLTSCWCR